MAQERYWLRVPLKWSVCWYLDGGDILRTEECRDTDGDYEDASRSWNGTLGSGCWQAVHQHGYRVVCERSFAIVNSIALNDVLRVPCSGMSESSWISEFDSSERWMFICLMNCTSSNKYSILLLSLALGQWLRCIFFRSMKWGCSQAGEERLIILCRDRNCQPSCAEGAHYPVRSMRPYHFPEQ